MIRPKMLLRLVSCSLVGHKSLSTTQASKEASKPFGVAVLTRPDSGPGSSSGPGSGSASQPPAPQPIPVPLRHAHHLESGPPIQIHGHPHGPTQGWAPPPTPQVARSRAIRRFWISFAYAWLIYVFVGYVLSRLLSPVHHPRCSTSTIPLSSPHLIIHRSVVP